MLTLIGIFGSMTEEKWSVGGVDSMKIWRLLQYYCIILLTHTVDVNEEQTQANTQY